MTRKKNHLLEKEDSRWIDRAKKMIQTDNQVRETISMVNIITNYKNQNPTHTCTRRQAYDILKSNLITNETLDIQEVAL